MNTAEHPLRRVADLVAAPVRWLVIAFLLYVAALLPWATVVVVTHPHPVVRYAGNFLAGGFAFNFARERTTRAFGAWQTWWRT